MFLIELGKSELQDEVSLLLIELILKVSLPFGRVFPSTFCGLLACRCSVAVVLAHGKAGEGTDVPGASQGDRGG